MFQKRLTQIVLIIRNIFWIKFFISYIKTFGIINILNRLQSTNHFSVQVETRSSEELYLLLHWIMINSAAVVAVYFLFSNFCAWMQLIEEKLVKVCINEILLSFSVHRTNWAIDYKNRGRSQIDSTRWADSKYITVIKLRPTIQKLRPLLCKSVFNYFSVGGAL